MSKYHTKLYNKVIKVKRISVLLNNIVVTKVKQLLVTVYIFIL